LNKPEITPLSISNHFRDSALDDQKELKYLRQVRGFKWQIIVVIFYAAIALGTTLVVLYGMYTEVEAPRGLLQFLLGGCVGSFIAALLMARTVHPY
jgi:hypothetical protein